MSEREKIIRLWFDMWLKQQDLGMDKIFTEDVVYTESWLGLKSTLSARPTRSRAFRARSRRSFLGTLA